MDSSEMSGTLTEGAIEQITDLFQAFQLMQRLKVNPKGVTTLEDAKCRLLQYIQEKYGAGKPRRTDAQTLFKEVLEDDFLKRFDLTKLYQGSLEYVGGLPLARKRELHANIADFDRKLQQNMDSVTKSDCAILVAGEVSAGKSSLLNLLLGEELLPTSLLSCTSVLCELRHSNNRYARAHPWDAALQPERVDLEGHDKPMELLAKYIHQKGDRSQKFPYKRVEIYWPFTLLQGGVFIVDSPGIGESREMTQIVRQYLPSAFAFIYVINSSNAGGLQPDRLQDLLTGLSAQQDNLGLFDPRSAIFVCNKWDQVPAREEQLVQMDTMEKLKRCWPGINQKQVFFLSATKAFKSLDESGYVTKDYGELLEGIERLLPLSLQCKLENHCRWLSRLHRRSAFHLRVYIANETRSDEERKELTEQLHDQLDHLDTDARRVAQELKVEVQGRAVTACDQLVAHLASASTRSRLLRWEKSECPDGDDWDLLQELLMAKANKRIRREVHDWDVKNGIFLDIQMDLLHRFQEEFSLMEDQLGVIESGLVGRGGRPGDTLSYMRTLKSKPSMFTPMLSTKQKIALGLAAPILIPLGVVAGMFVLPVAAVKAIRAKLEDMKLLKEYRKSKVETMSVMTDEVLENFLDKNNLTKLIQTQLHVTMQSVDNMVKSIPDIIEADRAMISKLQQEREATEVSLAEQYLPTYQKCQELQGQLDHFYITKVRQYDIGISDIEWDANAPPIASGSFGDVHAAKWKKSDDHHVDVAIKFRREAIDEKNATDILIEEENLRKFRHENIVEYYGTTIRQSRDGSTQQLVMVMELCETTLRTRIVGPKAQNPGRLGDTFALYVAAIRLIGRYLQQLCSALIYLHQRALVHRDLKPQNILINSHDVIKVADVGLTKPECDISGTICGTTCYSAPEVLEGAEYDKSADIYSLGMIIWELWYGRLVHDELASVHKGDVDTAVRAGNRPSLAGIHMPPDDWKAFIRRCWAQNIHDRPSSFQCQTFLDTVNLL